MDHGEMQSEIATACGEQYYTLKFVPNLNRIRIGNPIN